MRLQLLLLALLLGACVPPVDEPGAPPVDDDDSTEPVEEPRGWEGVFALISFRCGCHDAMERAGEMWDLTEEDSAWDALVSTPSNDVPGVNRIEPGDPDASYLYLKVLSRQGEVGGFGSRMPPTGFALSDGDVALIREWIRDGAERD